jgi:hypothetical protein
MFCRFDHWRSEGHGSLWELKIHDAYSGHRYRPMGGCVGTITPALHCVECGIAQQRRAADHASRTYVAVTVDVGAYLDFPLHMRGVGCRRIRRYGAVQKVGRHGAQRGDMDGASPSRSSASVPAGPGCGGDGWRRALGGKISPIFRGCRGRRRRVPSQESWCLRSPGSIVTALLCGVLRNGRRDRKSAG